MDINKLVSTILGEQNFYKIDWWKYPDKRCRHNNEFFCEPCRREIENEGNK